MKKLIYLFLFATVLSLNSCSEWLNVTPEDDQTTDEYWQTKEEVEAVLGAGYSQLRENLEEILVWGEARGNSLVPGIKATADQKQLSDWNIIATNDYCNWGGFYKIINQANMVIKYAPSVVPKDPSFNQALMKSYVAEAYYLRALSYFYLVRNFRDVPLVVDPYMTDEKPYEVAKSADTVVFRQIVADLDSALGSSKEFFPEVWASKGRATKWAVNATIADVSLWTGNFDRAIEACDAVINSGRVGLINGMVSTTNNWFTIFYPGNSNESIFELQYSHDKGQDNNLVSWFGTSNIFVLSPYMQTLFESSTEDIRGAGASYDPTNFQVWKYLKNAAGSAGVSRTYSDQNFVIYRMADIYLMKAEALAMKNQYEDAVQLVNKIRLRANITNPETAPSTQLETLKLILDERAREFVGEGKRWYDILRVGRYNNFQYKDYMINQVLQSASALRAPIIRATMMDVNSLYLPIHDDELKANELLVQNPYYEKEVK